MNRSDLTTTMARIATHSAEAVGDYLRSTNAGLNRHIRRTLALPPGQPGSLLADPIIEVAQDWAEAGQSLGDLAGGLLDRRLVEALDTAPSERMPRDRKPYLHQLRAWEAAGQGQSVLVSSGTGSGKTECFMIPVLDDILRNPGPVGGIRAIIVYPLNALIQSQRDRLSAWAAGLGGQVSYALYNGETPHRPDGTRGAPGEVLDRRSLRENRRFRSRSPTQVSPWSSRSSQCFRQRRRSRFRVRNRGRKTTNRSVRTCFSMSRRRTRSGKMRWRPPTPLPPSGPDGCHWKR